MGLTPVFKPVCPKCEYKLKYYAWDPQTSPLTWVMSEESRQHLATPHVVKPKLHIVQDEPYIAA